MNKERKEIYIDTEGFNSAQSKFNRKKEIELEIRKEVKRITKQVPSKDFYKDIEPNFYKMLKAAYKSSNPMDLSGPKLVMLMDIDTSKLFELESQYRKVKDCYEPSLVTFTIYADNDKELEKYNACMNVIKACEELNKHIKVFPYNVQQASSNAIQFNMRKNKLVVNHNWIKGVNRF